MKSVNADNMLPVFRWVGDETKTKTREIQSSKTTAQESHRAGSAEGGAFPNTEPGKIVAVPGDRPKSPSSSPPPSPSPKTKTSPRTPSTRASSSYGGSSSTGSSPSTRILQSPAAEPRDVRKDPDVREGRTCMHKQLVETVGAGAHRQNSQAEPSATAARWNQGLDDIRQTRTEGRDRRIKELVEQNEMLGRQLSQNPEEETEQLRREPKTKREAGAETKQRELSQQNESIREQLRAAGPLFTHSDDFETEAQGRKEPPTTKPPRQRFDEKKRKRYRGNPKPCPARTATDDQFEKKVAELESKRRLEEEKRRKEIAAQNKLFRQRLKQAESPIKSYKKVDKVTQQQREMLREQRRKFAEIKQLELKAHEVALKRQYCKRSSTKGVVVREMKLSPKTEAVRTAKQKERRAETERKNKELAERNALMRKLLEEAKGRDQKTLDSSVERARLEMERSRRREAEKRTKALVRRNAEHRERLAGTKCKVEKNLDEDVEFDRLEKEMFHNEEAVHRERELARKNHELKQRLEAARARDTKQLHYDVEAKRTEYTRARFEQAQSRKKELAAHRARLRKLVKGAKSPIKTTLAC